VTSCADSTFGNCDYLPPFVAFTFTFEKGADGWRGTVSFAEPRPVAVQVSGVETADGRSVTFSGATTPSTAGGETATVTGLEIAPDSDNGFTGVVSYAFRHAGSSARVVTLIGSITSAARGPAPVNWVAPTDLDGTWQVSTIVESCSHWQGGPCAGQYPSSSELTLVIRESTTAAPRAVVEFPSNVVAELTGTREPDGSLRFAGEGASPWSSFFRVEVPSLVVQSDRAAGLTGTFVYRRHHTETKNHAASAMAVAGTLTSATRRDFAFTPGRFHGAWSGDVVVEACLAGDCGALSPGSSRTLRLVLTQSGSAVAGTLHLIGLDVPLTGTSSGDSAHVTGQMAPTQCYEISMYVEQCGQRIENASLTRDEFGRLTGGFDYTFDGTNGVTPYSYTARLTLVAVVPSF
jgi:hypothetical protein